MIRFSVDELAEKISRGRASVPLERLASVCPDVFRESSGFPGEQEIQLPLQKLLEQVGLVAPKASSGNGIPKEQLARARAEATRIIEEASAAPQTPPAPVPPPVAPVPAPAPLPEAKVTEPAPTGPIKTPDPQGAETPRPAGIVKALSSILGLFSRSDSAESQHSDDKKQAEEKPLKTEEQSSSPQPAISSKGAVKAPAQPVPAGCISLRVLPVFRLLPSEIIRTSTLPPEDVRAILPLSIIDPQLARGHVEIPIDDFVKALPEDLQQSVNAVPGAQVWIPLDEIFQSLPPDHLFYMPPLDALPEPEAAVTVPPAEAAPERSEEPAAPVEAATTAPVDEPIQPLTKVSTPESEAPTTEPSAPETPPANETAPEPQAAVQAEPVEAPAISEQPTAPVEEAVEVAANTPPEIVPPVPSPAEELAVSQEPPANEPAPPTPTPPPARAPWMRGFQVPPPLLFTAGPAPAEASPESAPVEPIPQPAPTPEAKRTADFLANQNGIFAAAAFVEGAVFASADFPRKPDLDALRDFMGSFVDHARESGRRLGWNRVLTIACEHFYATAVVRERHFIVALHHDRILPTLAHDALISAADDLSKVG
jgi:hypothetical protein